jgi:hypothetical protein
VLIDFDDSRVGGPTNVDDNAVANMPTAIGPAARSGTPSPIGLGGLARAASWSSAATIAAASSC